MPMSFIMLQRNDPHVSSCGLSYLTARIGIWVAEKFAGADSRCLFSKFYLHQIKLINYYYFGEQISWGLLLNVSKSNQSQIYYYSFSWGHKWPVKKYKMERRNLLRRILILQMIQNTIFGQILLYPVNISWWGTSNGAPMVAVTVTHTEKSCRCCVA